jgi:hypothetical protein
VVRVELVKLLVPLFPPTNSQPSTPARCGGFFCVDAVTTGRRSSFNPREGVLVFLKVDNSARIS